MADSIPPASWCSHSIPRQTKVPIHSLGHIATIFLFVWIAGKKLVFSNGKNTIPTCFRVFHSCDGFFPPIRKIWKKSRGQNECNTFSTYLDALICLKYLNYFHDNRHYSDIHFLTGSEFINPGFIIYVSFFRNASEWDRHTTLLWNNSHSWLSVESGTL